MLDQKFPSFTKILTKSQVSGGFWMGLPTTFCKTHLPEYDVTVNSENENGQVHTCRYLFEKMGLSGGWRGFSIDNNLMAGDAAVFLLVKPTKFKRHLVLSQREQGQVPSFSYCVSYAEGWDYSF